MACLTGLAAGTIPRVRNPSCSLAHENGFLPRSAPALRFPLCNGGVIRSRNCRVSNHGRAAPPWLSAHCAAAQGADTPLLDDAGGGNGSGGGSGRRGGQGGGGRHQGGYGKGSDGGRSGGSSQPLSRLADFSRLLSAVLVVVLAPLSFPACAAAAASAASDSGPGAVAALGSPTPSGDDAAAGRRGGGSPGSTGTRSAATAPAPAAAAAAAADPDAGEAAAVAASSLPRVKRLLREAFAELSDLRARVDEAEEAAAAAADAAAAGDALVVPLEGFAVRPYSRALSADMRLRCRAQVSGTVDAPLLVPLLAFGPGSAADAAAAADSGTAGCGAAASATAAEWGGMLREAGLAPASAPRLRLRIQSLWAGENADPAAAKAGGGEEEGEGGRQRARQQQGQGRAAEGEQPHPRAAAAHLQLATEPGGGSAVVDKLLVKLEAHPRLRLLLATHGSLNNIAKNANPFAAGGGQPRGLTDPMRTGHDLTLLGEGGAGAAVAASAGDLSAAFGSFSSGGRTATCTQLSLHRSRRVALSAAVSTSAPSALGPVPAAAGPSPAAAGGGFAAAAGAGGFGGGEGRVMQRGLVGACQLTDRLTAAAWLGSAAAEAASSTSPRLSSTGREGGGSSGASDSGAGPLGPWAAAAAPHAGPLAPGWCRQQRMGFRLASLPDEETGRSYAVCVSRRSNTDSGSDRVGLLVAEASAVLPVAHGVVVSPGLVLLRRSGPRGCEASAGGGLTVLCAAAQTTWSF